MLYFGRVGSSWGHRAVFGSSWGEKVITPIFYIYFLLVFYIDNILVDKNTLCKDCFLT
jgi:uncharacterized membrane protein